jgi:signal transduction histidine kinase
MIEMRKYAYFILILVFFMKNNSFGGDKKSEVDSLISMPYNVIVSEPRKIINPLLKAIEVSKKTEPKIKTAKLYSNLALAYSSISEYAKYRDAAIIAIKLFEETNSEHDLVLEYGLLGFHLKSSNIKRSKYYMQLAIKLAEKNNLVKEIGGIYDNYGTVLELSNDLDSALFYYKKALDIKKSANDYIGIPYTLNHLAGLLAIRGNMKEAFAYMEKSDKYRAKEKSSYGRAENAVIYGELYEKVGNINLAIIKYNESLELAKVIGNKHLVQYNYEKLSGIYEKMEDFKRAYSNLVNHKNYQDSIINVETNKRIAELEIKFESQKKDKEISEAKLKLKEQREQIIVATVFSILLLIGIVAIYSFQKLKRKQIRNELELKNQFAKVEYENRISDEKLRISRELHDNIGSHLTFMISSIDNLTFANKDEKNYTKLNNLSTFGRNTLNELRQTIWAMKKSESTLQELFLKLNEFKTQILTDIDIQINNNIISEIKLTSTQTLNLFRIIQEAIQNTIKYANASKVNITFKQVGDEFVLSIEDNGSGFDISNSKMGNGISNMKFRCEEAGATFKIVSNNAGTKICCNIKIK